MSSMTAKQEARRANFTQMIGDNKACFRMCTSAINLCTTGLSSDELRKKYALDKKDSIRSVLTKEQVAYATKLEQLVATKLEEVEEKLTTFDIVSTIFKCHEALKGM